MSPSNFMNIRLAPDIYISPITDDGSVILDFRQDKVLSVNKTGAVILSKIASSESGLSRADLVKAVSAEINVSAPSRNESIVDDLIDKMNKKGLLQSSATPTSGGVKWLRDMAARCAVKATRLLIVTLLKLKLHTPAALVALAMVDVALKLIGINALRQIVSDWPINGEEPDSRSVAYVCSKVISACAWHSKKTLCLHRSATTTCLLRSIGAPAEMVIGVHKIPFYGHAWVEVHGKVVNDHPKVQTFFHTLSRC
jgi:hypothetical protein